MDKEVRPKEKPFLVLTTIKWPDGEVSERVVNWRNKVAVQNFAKTSSGALSKGGEVCTRRLTDSEVQKHTTVKGKE